MATIKDKLTVELEAFKAAYIERVKAWTIESVERSKRIRKAYFDATNEYKVTSKLLTEEEKKEKRSNIIKLQNEYNTLKFNDDCLNYILPKNLKAAEIHFTNTLDKLVERIKGKGLNEEKVEVVTAFVGVNLELTLSDSIKTVRAFTIIASGEIQKPHYRYLIK